MPDKKKYPSYESFYRDQIDWIREAQKYDPDGAEKEVALIKEYGPYDGSAAWFNTENQRLLREGKPPKYTAVDFDMLRQQNRLGQDYWKFRNKVEDARKTGGLADPGGLTTEWYDLTKRATALSAYPKYRETFHGAAGIPPYDDRTHAVLPDTGGYSKETAPAAEGFGGALGHLHRAYKTHVDPQGRALTRGGETRLDQPERWEDKVEALERRIFPAPVLDQIQESAESETDITDWPETSEYDPRRLPKIGKE